MILSIAPDQSAEVLPDTTPESQLKVLHGANYVILRASTVWGQDHGPRVDRRALAAPCTARKE